MDCDAINGVDLLKILVATKILGGQPGQGVAITDEIIGAPQLLGLRVPGLTPQGLCL